MAVNENQTVVVQLFMWLNKLIYDLNTNT